MPQDGLTRVLAFTLIGKDLTTPRLRGRRE